MPRANNHLERSYRKHVFKTFAIVVCRWCNCPLDETDATTEHIVPLNRGGKHERSNFDVACRTCNETRNHVDNLCEPGVKCIHKLKTVERMARWIDKYGYKDPTLTEWRRTKALRKLRERWQQLADKPFPVK